MPKLRDPEEDVHPPPLCLRRGMIGGARVLVDAAEVGDGRGCHKDIGTSPDFIVCAQPFWCRW